VADRREGASRPRSAHQANLATSSRAFFTSDGQPKTRAAVFAAGASIGLLECLENDLLFVRGNADARVGLRKRPGRFGMRQGFVVRTPALVCRRDLQRDFALLGELKGIGEQF